MGVPSYSGRTSWLKRGKRNGCDQRISSDSCEATTARSALFAERRPRNEEEEVLRGAKDDNAASLRACRDVVRFDLKDDLGLLPVARSCDVVKSSSSSSPWGRGIKGWSSQLSRTAGVLGDSLRATMLDLRLRIDIGVAGLPMENIEWASPSNDGTESLDSDRSYEDLWYSSDCSELDLASSCSSAFSKRMLKGLLS